MTTRITDTATRQAARAAALIRTPPLMPSWLDAPQLGQRVLIVTCLHGDLGPELDDLSGWLHRVTGLYPLRYQVPGGGFAFCELTNYMLERLTDPAYAASHGGRVAASRLGLEAVTEHVDLSWVIAHAGHETAAGVIPAGDECIELDYRLGITGLPLGERTQLLHDKVTSAVNIVHDTVQRDRGQHDNALVPTIGWSVHLAGSTVREHSRPIHAIGAESLVLVAP